MEGHLELKDLRWAIAASQCKSLRQTAEVLNLQQSTLSRRLRDLECRLGAVLFDRSTSGTQPTAVGREFLKAARRIVTETDSVFSRLSAYGRGESGELSLGITMALSAGNLRATLLEHRQRFPDVRVRVADGGCIGLLSDLAGDSLDVVILTGDGVTWSDRALPLWHERVVVALPDGHRLCAKDSVQWNELKAEPMLINRRDPGPEFHRLLLAKLGCRELGLTTEHDIGTDRLLSLVGAGFGLTLALEGATGATYPGVVYREVHDENGPTRLAFKACWRQANSNPTLISFLTLLRERYPDLSGAGCSIEALTHVDTS